MDDERSSEPVVAGVTSPPRRTKRLGLWVALAGLAVLAVVIFVGIIPCIVGFPAGKQVLRAMSATTLKGIGAGLKIHMDEHEDRWPDNLVVLVDSGLISAGHFFSPSSGRRVRADKDGKPIPPFDYVYLAPKKALPDDAMVAYERPEINKGEGTWVLMADYRVEWVSMEEFVRRLTRSEQLLKEQEAP